MKDGGESAAGDGPEHDVLDWTTPPDVPSDGATTTSATATGSGSGRRRRSSRPDSSPRDAWGNPLAVASTSGVGGVFTVPLGLWGLLATVTGAVAWFGGRTPAGQILFVTPCLITAAIILWTSYVGKVPSRRLAGLEFFVVLALGLLAFTAIPLPESILQLGSPALDSVLALHGAEVPANPVPGLWPTLSLAPAATWQGVLLLGCYAVLFFSAVTMLRTSSDLIWLLQALAVATAAWSLFALAQYALSNGNFYWIYPHQFASTEFRVTGPFSNRNHFAHLLALGLAPQLVCLARSLNQRRERQQDTRSAKAGMDLLEPAVWMSALAITVIALLFSFSRGGLLAAAVAVGLGCVLLFVVQGRQAAGMVLAVLSLGTITSVAGFSGLDRVLSRVTSEDNAPRWKIWEANWQVFREFPWFGTGIGTHADAHWIKLVDPVPGLIYTHAESSLLQVASETGLIGLGLAAIAMLLALRWPLATVSNRSADVDTRMAAAAVLAALVAHLVHACADFLWYVPGCMATVVLLAAMGRASWWSVVQDRLSTSPRSLLGSAARLACVVALGGLILPELMSAASAETSLRDYQWLVHKRVKDLEPGDGAARQEWETEKARVALQAAKSDPADAHTRVLLADAYLRMFELHQQSQDVPLSLIELKDAAAASEFVTAADQRKWLIKVAGKNLKFLEMAWQHARFAVRHAPLQGQAYLLMMELAFLHDPSGRLEMALMDQAVLLRPSDPRVQFIVGKHQLMRNERENGIRALLAAFRGSKDLRGRAAAILVTVMTPDEIRNAVALDDDSAGVFAQAYATAGQDEESRMMRQIQAELALRDARENGDPDQQVRGWQLASSAYLAMERPDEALRLLQEGVQSLPQNVRLRHSLADLMTQQGRGAAAQEHWKWLLARDPQNRLFLAGYERARIASRPTATIPR